MSNIDKQAGEGDVSPKTYYIHPMAFGGTQNPGHGHVPVVHADDFEKQRAKLEAAEKRIAKLETLAFCPAILDVISERQRQRAVEGWTSEHDDAYQNSELADAAACYAINAHNQGFSTPAHWPWAPDWWKQSGPRRDLVKAGALILAEIERIDRAAAGKGE